MKATKNKSFVSTRNACKQCSPLGACMVFRGIEGGLPLLHGSQGCATYVRRYIISHFREPMDVASSNFSESTAVFGGKDNLTTALDNVIKQYHPKFIGVATTCLSETIGENVPHLLRDYLRERTGRPMPALVHASTPSYAGSHMEGFHAAVKATVDTLADGGDKIRRVNLFPGFLSPADLRHLKEILEDFNLPFTLFPDYSETLDAPTWDRYRLLPDGGTTMEDLKGMGANFASIEFGRTLKGRPTGAESLRTRFGVTRTTLGTPIGVDETDLFFQLLEVLSGRPVPEKYVQERGRLIDSFFDAHKYVFEKRAIVYGEEDLVVGLASFLASVGIVPVLCASGGESGRLEECIREVCPQMASKITVKEGVDFADIEQEAVSASPDLFIGNSKGYPISRKLNVPFVRVGFPLHDSLGGQRVLHIGYQGAQGLFDSIVNAVLRHKQDVSTAGYAYM